MHAVCAVLKHRCYIMTLSLAPFLVVQAIICLEGAMSVEMCLMSLLLPSESPRKTHRMQHADCLRTCRWRNHLFGGVTGLLREDGMRASAWHVVAACAGNRHAPSMVPNLELPFSTRPNWELTHVQMHTRTSGRGFCDRRIALRK